MADFDYVILGAGSAGCVLANRLTADRGINVALVEAGPRDRNPMIRIPKGFGKLLGDPKWVWHYPITPIGRSQRVEAWVRGKTLGGSSAVNGMIYNRGFRADYDELERLGNPGWGWDTILPIYKQIEDHSLGASPLRGSGGPLHVSRVPNPDPLCVETVEAGATLGWQHTDDVNSSDEERIGHAVCTIKNGRRVSSAHAFLHPIKKRSNLTVITATAAEQLLFDGDRVVGVRTRQDGNVVDIRARREVLMSLGSLASPKLLQLSGIGSSDVLREAGVDVRLDRPNVGARMREHRCFVVQYRLSEDLGYNSKLSTGVAQARVGAQYLLSRRGVMAKPSYDVVAFFKTRSDLDRPDAQILMAPFTVAEYAAGGAPGIERTPGMQCIGYVLRPDSQGSALITSAQPDAPLEITPNFLSTEHDRSTGLAVFRKMRELFATEPIAKRINMETVPGAATDDDDEIVQTSAFDRGYCGYHAVGTCAMGPSDEDVVDSSLRVRGVDGLRIIDCSVMPTMVAGNLNGPIMAMAWHAADLILADR
jgi:choline dehydrogenase-like flavoprotein